MKTWSFLVLIVLVGGAQVREASGYSVPFSAKGGPAHNTKTVFVCDVAHEPERMLVALSSHSFLRSGEACGKSKSDRSGRASLYDTADWNVWRTIFVWSLHWKAVHVTEIPENFGVPFDENGLPGAVIRNMEVADQLVTTKRRVPAPDQNDVPSPDARTVSGQMLIASNFGLIAQNAPRAVADASLNGAESYQKDIEEYNPVLDYPGRTLAYCLTMVAFVLIDLFYASRLVAGGWEALCYTLVFDGGLAYLAGA